MSRNPPPASDTPSPTAPWGAAPPAPGTPADSPSPSLADVLAAAAVLVGGLVHLYLYFRFDYRSLGSAELGRSFLANGIASIVLAAVLVARPRAIVRLAALGLVIGTLVAFVLSRTLDRGIFGFEEHGLTPSPQAAIALAAEILALVLLVAGLVTSRGRGHAASPRRFVPASVAALMLAVGLGATGVWAQQGAIRSSVAADVAIADFSFQPATITIKAGDSITWANHDATSHNVQSADHSFDSPEEIATGATFRHRFDTAGTFAYICGIHPQMTGTIVVSG